MHLIQEEILKYAEYLRKGGKDKLPDSILEHTEECMQCKKEVLELFTVLKEIDSGAKVIGSLNGAVSREFRIGAYIKVAAVIAIMVLPFYFFFTQDYSITKPPYGKSLSKTDVKSGEDEGDINESAKAGREELLAGDFKNGTGIYSPISEYEAVSGDVFRSQKLIVISPINAKESDGDVTFRLKFEKPEHRYIKVFNNRNKLVFTTASADTGLNFTETFPPGLYYWKLETASDLLYLGKFIIH